MTIVRLTTGRVGVGGNTTGILVHENKQPHVGLPYLPGSSTILHDKAVSDEK